MNPSIWVFDEPLSALDEKAQAWLQEFLQALQAAGKTLIVATHDAGLARTLAARTFTLTADHQLQTQA